MTLGLSLKHHPVALLRADLDRRGLRPTAQLATTPAGRRAQIAGLVLVRQRPGTTDVTFMTIEDETGIANLVVWPAVFARFRRIVMTGRLVACYGRVQREGAVIHLVAERLDDLSPLLAGLAEGPLLPLASHDFH